MAAALSLAAAAPPNGTRQAVAKVRLEFDVRTTQLAEVVARAQARLDVFGAAVTTEMLPPGSATTEAEVPR